MIMHKILRNVPVEAIPVGVLICGVCVGGTALGIRNTKDELFNQHRMRRLNAGLDKPRK